MCLFSNRILTVVSKNLHKFPSNYNDLQNLCIMLQREQEGKYICHFSDFHIT